MRIDQNKFPALFDDNLVISEYKDSIDDKGIGIYYNIVKEAKQNLFYISQTVMTPILQLL